jgi:hypothetical protein
VSTLAKKPKNKERLQAEVSSPLVSPAAESAPAAERPRGSFFDGLCLKIWFISFAILVLYHVLDIVVAMLTR